MTISVNSPEGVFVHPMAILETRDVGSGSRIWAFAHVLAEARIGRDANICDHVFIENDVVLGDRVTVKCGVQLWDGTRAEDDVFIGPNATFTNDASPRSKKYPDRFLHTVLRAGCSVGANATILPGLTLGPQSVIGAGAVVTRSVPPFAIVVGNPARIRGYVHTPARAVSTSEMKNEGEDVLPVEGVRFLSLPEVEDLRGKLSFAEVGAELPFAPKRFFTVSDVPTKEVRGEHAHRALEQILICVNGSLAVVVDNGARRAEITLDRPDRGLYLPPMTWATQYRYSRDAVLLVLCSDLYDPDDYIRDYDEFAQLALSANG